MMSNTPILIDTDGQFDSFWGLLLAKEHLNVTAITVCTGKNKNPEDAFSNALSFASLAGFSCPISKGSERSILKRERPDWPRYAPDGKCNVPLAPAKINYDPLSAWDQIYQQALNAKNELVVLCFGPMTNLACAFFKYPDLASMLKKVIFVGGSYDFGNYSSVVEINMATDPEAAQAIFQSGVQLEMYGYNAELKSAFSNSEIATIVDGAKGMYSSAFMMSAMSCKIGEPIYYGPALAVAGVSHPELVELEQYHVFLETKGNACRGRTTPLTMYTPFGRTKDTLVAMDVKKEQYVQLLKQLIQTKESL